MIAVTSVEVTRHDGSRDEYEVKRRGDTLSRVEFEVRGGGDRVQAARLVVFADLNEDNHYSEDEILHDVSAQLDQPARDVVWRNLPLDEAGLEGPFKVCFELQTTERGAITRTLRVLPDDLLNDFDV